MICTKDQPEQPEMPQQDGGGIEQPCRKQKSSKKEQEDLRMEGSGPEAGSGRSEGMQEPQKGILPNGC